MIYATLSTCLRHGMRALALALLLGMCLPGASDLLGMDTSLGLRLYSLLLAGAVLLQRPMASLALGWEMRQVEKISYEEFEAKTMENLRYFKQEMARRPRRQPGDHQD